MLLAEGVENQNLERMTLALKERFVIFEAMFVCYISLVYILCLFVHLSIISLFRLFVRLFERTEYSSEACQLDGM